MFAKRIAAMLTVSLLFTSMPINILAEEYDITSADNVIYDKDATLEQNIEYDDCIADVLEPTYEDNSLELHNPIKDKDGITTWDCVYFGKYWQNDTNGDGKADENDEMEPIKWRVLDARAGKAFLVSDCNLDAKPYDVSGGKNWTSSEKIHHWGDCSLRSWLNGYDKNENVSGIDYSISSNSFIDIAFTKEESNAIVSNSIRDTIYPSDSDDPDTTFDYYNLEDKIFLLNSSEIRSYGLNDDTLRMSKNSAYALSKGAFSEEFGKCKGAGSYWLRECGPEYTYLDRTLYVHIDGYIDEYGMDQDYPRLGVRPALYINLESDCYTYAGTVRSDEFTNGEEKYGIKNPYYSEDIHNLTWDCVYFGRYLQKYIDEKERIKWRVLAVDGNDAFLVADKIIDSINYNETSEDNHDYTWEKSTLRSNLNGYTAEYNDDKIDYSKDPECFYNAAFSDKEKAALIPRTILNDTNQMYWKNVAHNDTTDKVFLLSLDDLNNGSYGFRHEIYDRTEYAKAREVTPYAKYKGARASKDHESGRENMGWWDLRNFSAGNGVMYVSFYGFVLSAGHGVTYQVGICPAIHLDLSKTDTYYYAGTVDYYGGINEVDPPEIKPGEEEAKPDPENPINPGEDGGDWINPVTVSENEYTVTLALKQKLNINDLAKSRADGKNYKITYNNATDKRIVTFTSKGLLTAKKITTEPVIINIKKADVEFVLKINVVNPQFTYENSSVKSYSINVGDTFIPPYLNCGLKPIFSIPAKQEKFANVNQDTGAVYAQKKGTITLTAAVGEGRNARKVKTTIKIYDPQIVEPASTNLSVGSTRKLKIKNGVKKTIWSSSDETVATVDEKGIVKAVGEGYTVITGKNNGRDCTIKISVGMSEILN